MVHSQGAPPPYSGPSARTVELYRRALYLWDVLRNLPLSLVNLLLLRPLHYCLGGLLPVVRPLTLYRTDVPPNAAFIMDTLMNVMGHQVLADGVFNADPHAVRGVTLALYHWAGCSR